MSFSGSLGLLLLLGSLAVIPGPSDLLVAGCAVRRGYRSVATVTAGILVADLIFILAVVFGANAFFEYLKEYAHWLQWISSGVLVLIGIWILRAKVDSAGVDISAPKTRDYGFVAGFMITFCDPKALAFYFGVLPTFFDIQFFGTLEVSLLICLVSAVICATKAFYAWIAVRGMKFLPRLWAQSLLLKTVGFGLVVTGGLKLVL